MKPLKKCVNGCDAPIKKPSKVLCEKCSIDRRSRMIHERGPRF